MKLRTSPSLLLLYEIMSTELDVLGSYIEKTEKDIEESRKTYKNEIKQIEEYKEFEKDGEKHCYSSIEEFGGLTNDRHSLKIIFEEYFPMLQRRSVLITLSSFFERCMLQLCNELNEEYSMLSEIKGRKDKSFQFWQNYLTKIIGIKFEKEELEYIEIVNIQEIRNCIVHREGLVDEKIEQYVKSNKFLSGEKGSDIIISKEFLIHVLKSYNKYFSTIHSKLKNKTK